MAAGAVAPGRLAVAAAVRHAAVVVGVPHAAVVVADVVLPAAAAADHRAGGIPVADRRRAVGQPVVAVCVGSARWVVLVVRGAGFAASPGRAAAVYPCRANQAARVPAAASSPAQFCLKNDANRGNARHRPAVIDESLHNPVLEARPRVRRDHGLDLTETGYTPQQFVDRARLRTPRALLTSGPDSPVLGAERTGNGSNEWLGKRFHTTRRDAAR